MSKNLMAFSNRDEFEEAVNYCVANISMDLSYSEVERTEGRFENRMSYVERVVDHADYLRWIIERYKDMRIKELEEKLEEMPV